MREIGFEPITFGFSICILHAVCNLLYRLTFCCVPTLYRWATLSWRKRRNRTFVLFVQYSIFSTDWFVAYHVSFPFWGTYGIWTRVSAVQARCYAISAKAPNLILCKARAIYELITVSLVGYAGLEPAISCSRNMRDTNFANTRILGGLNWSRTSVTHPFRQYLKRW